MKFAKGISILFGFFALFAFFAVHSAAQARLAFDVASVKRSPDPRSVPVFTPVIAEIQPGGVWRSTFATVFGLLRTLYPGHLLPGQIIGPEWIGTEFYDINARGPASASADDLRGMARTLLADRFKLVMHTEKREVPAYLLVTARADGRLGPGMSSPSIDCDAYRAAKEKGAPLPVFEQTRVVPGADLRITAGGATIASIIPILSRELDRPVVDATGLTQLFDIEVQYSPGVLASGFRAGTAAQVSACRSARFESARRENDCRRAGHRSHRTANGRLKTAVHTSKFPLPCLCSGSEPRNTTPNLNTNTEAGTRNTEQQVRSRLPSGRRDGNIEQKRFR